MGRNTGSKAASRIAFRPWRWVSRLTAATLIFVFMLTPVASAGLFTPHQRSYTRTLQGAIIARDTVVGKETPDAGQRTETSFAYQIDCPLTTTSTVNGTLAPGFTDVFETGVPGIGVRFKYLNGQNGGYVTAPHTDVFTPSGSFTGNINNTREVLLVVTGQVSTGTFTTPPAMTLTWSGSCFETKSSTVTLSNLTEITSHTCTPSAPASVSLPSVPAAKLTPVGSTIGDTAFSLGLTCQSRATPYITFTDVLSPSNRGAILTLDPSSTATGVAVQLVNGQTPISFGPDSAVARNPNQRQLDSTGAAFTARYISTGTPTGGTVKAAASFTMSYQ